MAPDYWTNLYTPKTWKTAAEHGHTITGFSRPNPSGPGGYKPGHFKPVKIGDRFLCYVTGAMTWVGVLEITSDPFESDEPIWGHDNDGNVRFPIRYETSPIAVIADPKDGVPRDEVPSMTGLSDGQKRGTLGMGLRKFKTEDGDFLIHALNGHDPQPPALSMDWLIERTNWTKDALETLIDAIAGESKQTVLAGPPGTSKTWVAKHVIRYLTGDDARRMRLVQFHPSYGYEDFIEGLRPVIAKGGIEFKLVEGTVLSFAKSLPPAIDSAYLIIDEMNRANLSRVFGELMYLFEYRNERIDLRYTKAYSLPTSIRFVGTMNTADRSIRSIDLALRRRFEVFECPPDVDVLKRFYETRVNEVPDLLPGVTALNERLKSTLDRHPLIGHAFFMVGTMTPARLQAVWDRKIAPLIEEYLFDQPDVAESFSASDFWPSLK
jgi:MoxR-like ATPase